MDDPQKGGMAFFFFFLQPQLTPTDCHYVRMGPEMSFSNKRLEFQLFRTVNLTLKPKPSRVYCRPLATDCSGHAATAFPLVIFFFSCKLLLQNPLSRGRESLSRDP